MLAIPCYSLKKAIECNFELFSFSPYLDRPLEKEKVIPVVTCFIESLFMNVDRESFAKGQLQSPFVLFFLFWHTQSNYKHNGIPENSASIVLWHNPLYDKYRKKKRIRWMYCTCTSECGDRLRAAWTQAESEEEVLEGCHGIWPLIFKPRLLSCSLSPMHTLSLVYTL